MITIPTVLMVVGSALFSAIILEVIQDVARFFGKDLLRLPRWVDRLALAGLILFVLMAFAALMLAMALGLGAGPR